MGMEIRIPGRYAEIPLSRFIAYHKAKGDVQKLMGITGAGFRDVEALTPSAVKELLQRVADILELATAVRVQRFKKGAQTLALIPDLTEMTMREWSDLMALASDIWKEDGSTDYTNLPDFMAILYRPVTESIQDRYRIADYRSDRNDHKDILLDMTMDKVQGALLFFWSLRRKLLKDSLRSLEEKMTKAIAEARRELSEAVMESLAGGDGTT